MKNALLISFIVVYLLLIALPSSTSANAPDYGIKIDTFSDTWAACDDLGRKLPMYKEVGPPRATRYVGVFYFICNESHANSGPYDVTKILTQDPNAVNEKDNPLWGPVYSAHYWGEPLFGYYASDDEYVLRKHAQMLSDAGVDVIFIDVSNKFTYENTYMTMLRVFSDIRKHGGKTPQIAFLCPFWDPESTVDELYKDLYEPNLYSNLWFRWDGKPLILADPNLVIDDDGCARHDAVSLLLKGQTLGQSFTADKPFDSVGGTFATWNSHTAGMTLSLYKDSPLGKLVARKKIVNIPDCAPSFLHFDKPLPPGFYYLEISNPVNKVGWFCNDSDVYPRGSAYSDRSVSIGDRQFTVIASEGRHADIRKFFTFRKPEPDYFNDQTQPDMWSWLEVYPQHVFKNSKGEKEQMSVGVAQNVVGRRFGVMSEPDSCGRSFHNGKVCKDPNAVLYGCNFAEQWGRALKEDPEFVFVTGWNEWTAMRFDNEFSGIKQPVIFVDEFDQEHSRDIEPMKGGHGDNYYYQLVSYIRRYKGVRKPQVARFQRTIQPDGSFAQWLDVVPVFRDDYGDTAHRSHAGFDISTQYVNNTGRNDIVEAKVAADQTNIYFYVQTSDVLTDPVQSNNWILLFIDADMDHKTGWNGYDYVINRSVENSNGFEGTVEKCSGNGWDWMPIGRVKLNIQKNKMQFAIERSMLNLEAKDLNLSFYFKWADNISDSGNIIDFLDNGDTAPDARFNYVFTADFK
ncbi:MAG: hypothetical protein ABFD64_13490 [Armatimonadota bacterium]